MIADRLTLLGIPTPRGKCSWSASTIKSLVGVFDKLYQYAGFGFWNRRNWQTGIVQDRDSSEWVVEPNAHPAVITEEECESILALADQEQRPRGPYNRRSQFGLSSGLIKCAHCHANYAGAPRHGDPYYACGSHLYRRGAGCGPFWYIRRDDVENLVVRKLLARASEKGIRARVARMNAELDAQWLEFQATASERAEKISKMEAELQNLLNVAASGGEVPGLAEKIKGVSNTIATLRRLEQIGKPTKIEAADVIGRRAEIEAAYASADADLRKSVLKPYVAEIIADSERKALDGRLIDPLAPGNDEGEPDIDNTGSPVYRSYVALNRGNSLMFASAGPIRLHPNIPPLTLIDLSRKK